VNRGVASTDLIQSRKLRELRVATGDAPKTRLSNSGECAWISGFREFQLFSACIGGDGAMLKTKWRWVQSGANRSPGQISLLSGNNTGILLDYGLDEAAQNPSTALNSGHLSQLDLDLGAAWNRDLSLTYQRITFPCSRCLLSTGKILFGNLSSSMGRADI
jgi:hypothetical protein